MASKTVSHFEKKFTFLVVGVVILKPHYKIISTLWHWDTECTGKSPDPLYLRAGGAIHLVL